MKAKEIKAFYELVDKIENLFPKPSHRVENKEEEFCRYEKALEDIHTCAECKQREAAVEIMKMISKTILGA